MRPVLLIPLLALGCSSTPRYRHQPPPPIVLETTHGTVRAQSRSTAEAAARALQHAPEIRERLHSTRAELPELWVLASPRAHLNGAVGACGRDRVQVGFDALLELRSVVAHELVHWYIVDSPFEGVPLFIEEGLAEFIAQDTPHHPNSGAPIYLLTDGSGVTPADLDADRAEAITWPMERYGFLQDVGAGIVYRLGLDRVRELAEQGADAATYQEEAGRVKPRLFDAEPSAAPKSAHPATHATEPSPSNGSRDRRCQR